MSNFNTFLTREPFGKVPTDFAKRTFDFIDERKDGGLDKALHPGVHFGPWKFTFNSTASKPLGDCTFEAGSVVKCVGHGLVDPAIPTSTSTQVRLETTGVLPAGLSQGEYYRVGVLDVDHLQLYLNLVLVVFVIGENYGDNVLIRRGTAYDFTGASVSSWVKSDPEAADSGKFDLQPTISTTVPGQVIIDLTDTETDILSPAPSSHDFWDMVITLAAADRSGPWVSGLFDITKLVTHDIP